MTSYAIFGASGCGRGVMPLARRQMFDEAPDEWELVFVDDSPITKEINGCVVLTYDQWLRRPVGIRYANIAIANGRIRQKIAERCSRDGIEFFEVRAKNVVEMDDVIVGAGAILSPFVTLTSNIRIGVHFHANLYSYVEHDCVIGDYVTFAPGVKCNGNIIIEDHVYVGAGASLRQGTEKDPMVIGRGAVIGMGAVVLNDVAPGVTVVGNPARILNKHPLK